MKIKLHSLLWIIIFFLFSFLLANSAISQQTERIKKLDERVQKFLDSHRGAWRDMNVPTSYGKILK